MARRITSSAARASLATAQAGVALSSSNSGNANIAIDTCTDFIEGIICKETGGCKLGFSLGSRGKYGCGVKWVKSGSWHFVHHFVVHLIGLVCLCGSRSVRRK